MCSRFGLFGGPDAHAGGRRGRPAPHLREGLWLLGRRDHRFPRHLDTDESAIRAFVFAISTGQPDRICRDGQIPHRWIDNITISDLVPGINPVLRTYYATDHD